MDHTQPYSDAYLQGILKSVKSIAMVGASPDKTKFSYGVLRVLSETGYDMIPVNRAPGWRKSAGSRSIPTSPASTARWTWCRCFAAPRT